VNETNQMIPLHRRKSSSDSELSYSTAPDQVLPSSPTVKAKSRKSALVRIRSLRKGKIPDGGAGEENPQPVLKGKQLKLVLDRAIRYFNLNPKRGLKFFTEKTCSRRDSPETVLKRSVWFLRNTKGLNKSLIGSVLGSDAAMLKEYVSTFTFEDCPATVEGVERGLRELFTHFKPPGESQQIERVVDCFAGRFALRSDPMITKDGIFQIAYLIIVLNVILHNPSVKEKDAISKEDFLKTYSNVPVLEDFASRDDLGRLYDNVSLNELRHDEDREDLAGNLFTDPVMSGWLEFELFHAEHLFPHFGASFTRRWVILSQNTLYYFNRPNDVDFLGFIPLVNVRLLTCAPSPSMTSSTSTRVARQYARLPRAPSLPMNDDADEEQEIYSDPPVSCSSICTNFRMKKQYERFVLVPLESNQYINAGRLSKSRMKNGKVHQQQLCAIAFRTQARDEFSKWIKALKQNGMVRAQTFTTQASSVQSLSWKEGLRKRLPIRYSGSFLPDNAKEEEIILEETRDDDVNQLNLA
jgi:hypothetical protein